MIFARRGGGFCPGASWISGASAFGTFFVGGGFGPGWLMYVPRGREADSVLGFAVIRVG